jgi:hypothetical protein
VGVFHLRDFGAVSGAQHDPAPQLRNLKHDQQRHNADAVPQGRI